MEKLLSPVQLGALALRNRIVMAPMTRSRATPQDDLPTDLHRIYYAQRASAGLIVTEGVHPSANGKGYCRTPGIFSAEQVRAWSGVVDAVHRAGASFVMQLMHVGRITTHHNRAAGTEAIAPSAIRAAGTMYTDDAGTVDFDTPRALRTDEVPKVVDEFHRAAGNAKAAGFDGVELHCSSGYLPMQFLSTGTNRRDDRYGGPAANRIRFVVEVMEALIQAMGPGRVGLRICPGLTYNDLQDDDPVTTYSTLLRALRTQPLAYIHAVRSPRPDIDVPALVRAHFDGPIIANDGYDGSSAAAAVSSGMADAISFARHYIANPDLVERLRDGAPLATFARRTLYTPGPNGYIDYPPIEPRFESQGLSMTTQAST
jgi:N-ethylmaleimide reductase